jgi:hypothetical protein
MRGDENQQESMFNYVNLDRRVPPLRAICKMAAQALAELSGHFDALYARRGRPSKPPEQLIRALRDEMGLRPKKIPRAGQRITLGADHLYQERKFIGGLRQRQVVPHVAE